MSFMPTNRSLMDLFRRPWLRRWVFWQIFRAVSSVEVPPNVLTERLMRREYVDALLRLGDRNLFLAGMMYWTGFSSK